MQNLSYWHPGTLNWYSLRKRKVCPLKASQGKVDKDFITCTWVRNAWGNPPAHLLHIFIMAAAGLFPVLETCPTSSLSQGGFPVQLPLLPFTNFILLAQGGEGRWWDKEKWNIWWQKVLVESFLDSIILFKECVGILSVFVPCDFGFPIPRSSCPVQWLLGGRAKELK